MCEVPELRESAADSLAPVSTVNSSTVDSQILYLDVLGEACGHSGGYS